MKKKYKYVIGSLLIIASLTACGKKEQQVEVPVEEIIEDAEGNLTVALSQEIPVKETTETEQETETEEISTEAIAVSTGSATEDFFALSEGDLEARREQQRNFQEARELLYTLDNSVDKTLKINQMDRQILENNAYPFFDKTIVFIGDSITEGVGAAVSQEYGSKISYAVYAGDALHAKNTINNGKGGRMYADYGGEELSLVLNYDNVINNGSDIFVVFAGANDYMSVLNEKRFGDINNQVSTAGYCGAVRTFFKSLNRDFPDCTVFIVLMYDFDMDIVSDFSDIDYQPTLNDYLEVQRVLAKEYGFEVIDLYSQGFMACTTEDEKAYFLDDFVHPKDMGSLMLGEHIAAEISYYFSQQN